MLKVWTRECSEGFCRGRSIELARYASEPVSEGRMERLQLLANACVGQDDRDIESADGGAKSRMAVCVREVLVGLLATHLRSPYLDLNTGRPDSSPWP